MRASSLALFRLFCAAASIGSAIGGGHLSDRVASQVARSNISEAGVSLDSGADGGAAGCFILSGLSLIAIAITFLRKD